MPKTTMIMVMGLAVACADVVVASASLRAGVCADVLPPSAVSPSGTAVAASAAAAADAAALVVIYLAATEWKRSCLPVQIRGARAGLQLFLPSSRRALLLAVLCVGANGLSKMRNHPEDRNERLPLAWI